MDLSLWTRLITQLSNLVLVLWILIAGESLGLECAQRLENVPKEVLDASDWLHAQEPDVCPPGISRLRARIQA